MSTEDDPEERPKSKSQVKRELLALQDMGKQLLKLDDDALHQIADERLREALITGRKLRPGNAAKRQMQYIGKLLRTLDTADLQQLIDRAEGRSRERDFQFHRLERWRQALLEEDPAVIGEIIAACPQADLPHLRQLVRAAIQEAARDPSAKTQGRRLFQELRALVEGSPEP